jgi:hypothetical protein
LTCQKIDRDPAFRSPKWYLCCEFSAEKQIILLMLGLHVGSSMLGTHIAFFTIELPEGPLEGTVK